MGSTVTTGKKAFSFQSTAGNVFFVLMEETYEKNCYPHTPRWSVIHYGDLASTLKRIFNYAAYCEGGMLKGRAGDIKPENYIKSWLRELKAPEICPNFDTDFRVADSYFGGIPTEKKDLLVEHLIGKGWVGLAQTIAQGKTDFLALYENAELLKSVFDLGIPAYRLIPTLNHPPAKGVSEFGYTPKNLRRDQVAPVHVEVFSTGDENRLIKKEGQWRVAGWSYSIVGDYIRQLGEIELAQPGAYRYLIPEFRDLVEKAQVVPDGTRVLFNERPKLGDIEIEFEVTEDGRFLAIPPKPKPDVTIGSTSWRNLYWLCRQNAEWLIPA